MGHLESLSTDMKEIISDVKKGKGTFGSLLRDGELADEVKEAHELSLLHQESFHIKNVGDLAESDEGLSFLLLDQDGNYWEILENQIGGYTRYFDGECDTRHALASFSERNLENRKSILKPLLMSHMTCEVIDIEKSRVLYEEVFGLDCIRLTSKRMLGRLNSVAVIDFKSKSLSLYLIITIFL